MDNKKIGLFIAERRKSLGMNQKELADKLSVTDKAISKWETGRGMPDISLLQPLAEELQVSLSELLNGELITEENISKESDKIILTTLKKSATRKRIIALLIVFSIILTAVFGVITVNSIVKKNKNVFDNVPSAIKTTSANVEFNAKVIVPDIKGDIYKYNSTTIALDNAEKYKKLLKSKNITDEQINPDDDFDTLKVHYLTTDKSEELSYGATYLDYNTEFARGVFSGLHPYFSYNLYASDGYYNLDKFSSNKNYDYCSQDEADRIIRKTIKDYGIELYEESNAYSIENETLTAEANRIAKITGDKTISAFQWTQDDNCYYFLYNQVIDGIPVCEIAHGDTDKITATNAINISALYSKNGIEMLNLDSIQNPDISTKQKVDVINLDTAVDAVKTKYANVTLNSLIIIDEIRFCYIPIRPVANEWFFELKLAWIFKENHCDEEDIYTNYIIIDAETGAEIY